jgi:hypothetical protein
VEANLPSVLLLADEAINLVGGEQMAMLSVTEAAFGAAEVPEGLSVHSNASPISTIRWEAASKSRKRRRERFVAESPFRAEISVRARRRSIGGHSPGLQARER